MTSVINPPQVRADATALVTYVGAPNRTVEFSLVSGDGVLAPISGYTDAGGRAGALYTPGTAGSTVVIRVRAGAP